MTLVFFLFNNRDKKLSGRFFVVRIFLDQKPDVFRVTAKRQQDKHGRLRNSFRVTRRIRKQVEAAGRRSDVNDSTVSVARR